MILAFGTSDIHGFRTWEQGLDWGYRTLRLRIHKALELDIQVCFNTRMRELFRTLEGQFRT